MVRYQSCNCNVISFLIWVVCLLFSNPLEYVMLCSVLSKRNGKTCLQLGHQPYQKIAVRYDRIGICTICTLIKTTKPTSVPVLRPNSDLLFKLVIVIDSACQRAPEIVVLFGCKRLADILKFESPSLFQIC